MQFIALLCLICVISVFGNPSFTWDSKSSALVKELLSKQQNAAFKSVFSSASLSNEDRAAPTLRGKSSPKSPGKSAPVGGQSYYAGTISLGGGCSPDTVFIASGFALGLW